MSMKKEEKRAAFSLAPWKRLWQSIRQHRVRLTVAIVSNLLLAVADFYIPLLQSKVVDQFILAGTTAGFSGYAAKYIGVCTFEIIMLFIYFKACMGLEMLSGRDMKEACFVNLQRLSLDYYNVTSAGHMLSRVMSDTDRIASCLAWVFPDILWGFAYILGVLGVMLSLSPGLAMTIIVIAPIVTALTVYFRDIAHFYSVFILAWTYFTPIFYPVEILPDAVMKLMQINPMYHLVTYMRSIVLYGVFPSLKENLLCLCLGLLMLALGLFVFYKKQDKFVLYV